MAVKLLSESMDATITDADQVRIDRILAFWFKAHELSAPQIDGRMDIWFGEDPVFGVPIVISRGTSGSASCPRACPSAGAGAPTRFRLVVAGDGAWRFAAHAGFTPRADLIVDRARGQVARKQRVTNAKAPHEILKAGRLAHHTARPPKITGRNPGNSTSRHVSP